jgi:hypothetical protein
MKCTPKLEGNKCERPSTQLALCAHTVTMEFRSGAKVSTEAIHNRKPKEDFNGNIFHAD